MKAWLSSVALAVVVVAAAAPARAEADRRAVLETYADIAHAAYEDSLTTGKALRRTVNVFLAEPGAATMQAAREAWLAARVPYMQTEVYRFGNPIVDDWEGKVNAWPLDEGLIDYVAGGYGTESADNPLYAANVIANPKLEMGGEVIDASTISKPLLADTLHEIGGIEANVAVGYHAIEFLLWGQDLNGTGPGSGDRPWSDYSTANCSNGHCARRAEYLRTVADLLVDDLGWMTTQWAPGGQAREALLKGPPDAGVAAIATGLGSLSYGELAGERMKLGLMLHDPEEEHDCFSDNTHNSHYYDVVGMRNVYTGTYVRVDGSRVTGPSLADLVKQADPALDQEMRGKLDATLAAMERLRSRAATVEAYDQMIGPDNPEGNAVVQAAIDRLTDQTRTIERFVATLKLDAIRFEGSDSLDDPAKVFQ